jgi:ATP-dependent RNA helicase DDX1
VAQMSRSNSTLGQQSASSASSNDKQAASSSYPGPFGLIIEPTRELAQQVYDEIQKFKKFLGEPSIQHVLCVGGDDVRVIQKALQQQHPHIVIGTPGFHLVTSSFQSIRQLVICVIFAFASWLQLFFSWLISL